jgi:hypothetical protein
VSYTPLPHNPSAPPSAYPNTSSHMPTRRPTNNRPPPCLAQQPRPLRSTRPQSTTQHPPRLSPNRTCSAPSCTTNQSPYEHASSHNNTAQKRVTAPRPPPGQQFSAGRRFPVSAPPRIE